ncbi:MAG: FAD-binding oxidoreductase [Myxococcota bacterium]|nr:FAD-binding oxidoreductase [Myxococcota bacterium]
MDLGVDVPSMGGVGHSVRDLESFGGRRARRGVVVFEPESEAQLAELLATASERGLRLAPLGAALSFDGQGLPERYAVSTARLRTLRVVPDGRRLLAGAGVSTGAALDAALERGLALPVMPSTSRVTMGGSASSDAYSRMTPGLGRESRHIRRVRVVTARGEVHECTRERNAALFRAAIGGFGLAGVITEVEHALESVGSHAALRSSAHAFEGLDGLEFLFPESRPPGLPPGPWPGAGCVVMQRGLRRRTLITRHRMESTLERRPTIAHQSGVRRVGLELLVHRMPALAALAWQVNWVPGRVVSLVDDLAPATFFMDGNLKARGLRRRFGERGEVLQQSFVLPIEGRSSAEVHRVEGFAREAMDRLSEAGQTAGMFDVGFLPRSERFVLSPNPDRDAFLVSLAFVVRRAADARAIERIFRKLTRVCRETHGGTVLLSKQARCDDADLREMYRPALEQLRELRRVHDPGDVIETALGRRLGLGR